MNRERLLHLGAGLFVLAQVVLIGLIVRAGPPPLDAAPALWIDNPANGGWYVQKPPVRFMRGTGGVAVLFAPPADVARLCGIDPGTIACASPRLMILPDPCTPDLDADPYAQLVCHEGSHAFGHWKHEAA